MNYWKKVANMLGVELDEQFKVNSEYGVWNSSTFYFSEKGFDAVDDACGAGELLNSILSGKSEIIKLPWKPQNGKQYWYYYSGDGAECAIWKESTWDLHSWKIGNCFRTEEEAWGKGQKLIEQIQKEFEEA